MESSWQCPLFRCFFVVTALTITSYVIRVLSVPFPFIATVSDAFGTLLPHHFNSKDFPAKFQNKVLQYGAEAKRPRFSNCESQTIGCSIQSFFEISGKSPAQHFIMYSIAHPSEIRIQHHCEDGRPLTALSNFMGKSPAQHFIMYSIAHPSEIRSQHHCEDGRPLTALSNFIGKSPAQHFLMYSMALPSEITSKDHYEIQRSL